MDKKGKAGGPSNPRRDVELTTRQSKRDSKSRGDEDEETERGRRGAAEKNKETGSNRVRVIVRRRGSSSGQGDRK